jgi:CRP-like cAMP-binding protein
MQHVILAFDHSPALGIESIQIVLISRLQFTRTLDPSSASREAIQCFNISYWRLTVTNLLIQKLKRLPLLSISTETLFEKLASIGSLRRYQRLESIYLQNDEPKAAYLIISGTATRESTQNRDLSVQHSRAFAGEWLGLANATSRTVPYMHSAFSADASEILSFDIHRFAALRLDLEFSHYLLQVASREQLAEEERLLNALSSTRSYDKLIRFLATEMGKMQKRTSSAIHLPFVVGTQQYFAEAIGTSRETVSRDLKPLLDAGILERSRGVSPVRYTILKQGDLIELASSPMRRSTLYENARRSKLHRRFSDVA